MTVGRCIDITDHLFPFQLESSWLVPSLSTGSVGHCSLINMKTGMNTNESKLFKLNSTRKIFRVETCARLIAVNGMVPNSQLQIPLSITTIWRWTKSANHQRTLIGRPTASKVAATREARQKPTSAKRSNLRLEGRTPTKTCSSWRIDQKFLSGERRIRQRFYLSHSFLQLFLQNFYNFWTLGNDLVSF